MEEVRKLDCGHMFDKKCIADWLSNRMNCPICRRAVLIQAKSSLIFNDGDENLSPNAIDQNGFA